MSSLNVKANEWRGSISSNSKQEQFNIKAPEWTPNQVPVKVVAVSPSGVDLRNFTSSKVLNSKDSVWIPDNTVDVDNENLIPLDANDKDWKSPTAYAALLSLNAEADEWKHTNEPSYQQLNTVITTDVDVMVEDRLPIDIDQMNWKSPSSYSCLLTPLNVKASEWKPQNKPSPPPAPASLNINASEWKPTLTPKLTETKSTTSRESSSPKTHESPTSIAEPTTTPSVITANNVTAAATVAATARTVNILSECPICFKHYADVDPTSLPCGHSCCIEDAKLIKNCIYCGMEVGEYEKLRVNFIIRDLCVVMRSMTSSDG